MNGTYSAIPFQKVLNFLLMSQHTKKILIPTQSTNMASTDMSLAFFKAHISYFQFYDFDMVPFFLTPLPLPSCLFHFLVLHDHDWTSTVPSKKKVFVELEKRQRVLALLDAATWNQLGRETWFT